MMHEMWVNAGIYIYVHVHVCGVFGHDLNCVECCLLYRGSLPCYIIIYNFVNMQCTLYMFYTLTLCVNWYVGI